MGICKETSGYVHIEVKKMVRYCHFVKKTGYVDFTTPGLVDLYNQWKESYVKN